MRNLSNGTFTGERALFQGKDLIISDSVFEDGESPLKHSSNIELYGSMFRWKYPLWYSRDIKVTGCTFLKWHAPVFGTQITSRCAIRS